MDIQQFRTEDGIELYIDINTGYSFASQRGYARMVGMPESTLRGRLKNFDTIDLTERESPETLDTSEELTARDCAIVKLKITDEKGQKRKVNLLTEKWISQNLKNDNPDLLEKMSQLGVRATLHQWAGFEVKTVSPNNKPQLPQSYDEAILELAEQIKQRKKLTKEVIELNYYLGNIKQTVKENLEAFDEVFDESKSVEENLNKFTEVTELYFKELARLDHILHSCANRDTVNHFIFINEGILDKNDRRAFGRLVKITCERLGIKYDAQTRKKDGQDLNCNHYPVTVLQTLLDLFGRGQNYAQIVDIYARIIESK